MKTIKKSAIFAICLILGTLISFSGIANVTVLASDTTVNGYERLQDMAGLLDEDSSYSILDSLNDLSDKYSMDFIIITENEMDASSVVDEADNFYDEMCGINTDGVLLLISMEDRDWYISTSGYGITAFTDAGISYVGEQILSDLSDGYYEDAFSKFIDLADDFMQQAKAGTPYDSSTLPKKPISLMLIVISLVLGLVFSLIIVSSFKNQLKTVRFEASASNYLKKGSLNITESSDIYLFSTISRVKKEKNKGSGSSTHTSSSGGTHGGGGGHF